MSSTPYHLPPNSPLLAFPVKWALCLCVVLYCLVVTNGRHFTIQILIRYIKNITGDKINFALVIHACLPLLTKVLFPFSWVSIASLHFPLRSMSSCPKKSSASDEFSFSSPHPLSAPGSHRNLQISLLSENTWAGYRTLVSLPPITSTMSPSILIPVTHIILTN